MKYFKFWVKESFQISIAGKTQEIKLLSGSNESKNAAIEEARNRAKMIEQRIADRSRKEEYEVAIKEHVSDIIDESNIISICRYGAKILNTNQYTILDLDDYPVDIFDVFKSLGKMSKKERIVFKFQERIKRYPLLGSDFRIYETTKGVRVIGKKYINPSEKNYTSLMRKLFVDWIYIQMSKKQNCYRARITPKPYRMRIRTIRIKSPLDCETNAYLDWSKEYEQKSEKYSVVKLIKAIGQDFSHEPVIKIHDRICNLHKNNKLA
ncbi:transmembrane prediction [Candidatus Thiomargarita nelsonii]|uniref:Transmembrane prediction n=1 Tax=Candidatus Thiomargarita nelsonii TaxID=1003181 RepID=A0A0A6P1B8_9GAMM|nr:transmembrane prediction [Candidatus Thiomargarita nelsonii]